MGKVRAGQWGVVVLLACCVLGKPAKAGGPIVFNEADGRTFPWRDNRAVYVVETGRLGVIENPQAAALVAQAFQRWDNVPTADLRIENLEGILPAEALAPFRRDITIEDFMTSVPCAILNNDPPDTQRVRIDCELLTACLAQGLVNCPSPVIFDEDGSITNLVFPDSGTLGFSGPTFLTPPGDSPESFRIVQAFTVLNGAFFDTNPQNSLGSDDPTGTLSLEAIMVHEFGHFLGLGHSQVNGETALLNPAVERVGTSTGTMINTALGPVDGLVAVRADDVETMYPVIVQRRIDNVSPLNTLERDDEASLSDLYPNAAALSATGSIAGSVFIPCTAEEATAGGCLPSPDGRPVKRAQGVLVTARRFAPDSPVTDLDGDAIPDARVLREAVSQVTGPTFAPLRCTTPDRRSVFGPCATPNSVDECSQTLQNFRVETRCGFFSADFSTPRATGDAAENRFELIDLPPGRYIVEATQVFTGGFASPVLGNFLDAFPLILSDDNRQTAFFPNPQPGEFYTGLPDGCGSTAGCGAESGSAADNPFAYTVLEVRAGGRVDNVNIVLNTTTTESDFISNPGLDFCGLADVNDDAVVDQRDIGLVVAAQAKFEKAQRKSRKKARKVLRKNLGADLNQDGSITALDVDHITDLVTIPPFSSMNANRALAPFAAICTAARDGGCAIQAPAETVRGDGTSTLPVCNEARTVGCEVSECRNFALSGCAAIGVPGSVSGNLSGSDQDSFFDPNRFADCYNFTGIAGQQLFIRLQGNFDTVLSLVGPDRQVIASNDDCFEDGRNSCIPPDTNLGGLITLPSDGTYTVEATSFAPLPPNTTGNYTLTLSGQPVPSGCTAIDVPTNLSGSLSNSDRGSFFLPGRFADCFTFSGNTGQQLALRVQGDFDTRVFLVGPDGQVVAANDDCPGDGSNSCIPLEVLSGGLFSLPSDGTYRVEVTSFAAGAMGNYSLTISNVPFQTGPGPGPGPEVIAGTLASGDLVLDDGSFADPLTFEGTAGQQISLRLQSTEFNTFLFVIGPDQQLVAGNNDCPGDGTNSCIPDNALTGGLLSLPSTGTYIIVVTSFAAGETGRYTLTASGGI